MLICEPTAAPKDGAEPPMKTRGVMSEYLSPDEGRLSALMIAVDKASLGRVSRGLSHYLLFPNSSGQTRPAA